MFDISLGDNLKFIWMPIWRFDPVDQVYYTVDWSRVLHYSKDNGFSWHPVDCEPFPDEETQAKRIQETRPNK